MIARINSRWATGVALGLALIAVRSGSLAEAQTSESQPASAGPSAPQPSPLPQPPAAVPAPPSPSLPNASSEVPAAAAPADPARSALEDRVRQLEAMVQQLSGQLQQLQNAPAAPGANSPPGSFEPSASGTPEADATGKFPGAGTAGAPAKPPVTPPGQSFPPSPPTPGFDSPAPLENKSLKSKFGPGFEWRTDDDEFILQFHNLTQVDYRGYQQSGQTPIKNTFGIPRQWFMFSGRMGKPYGYFVSFAHGFDTISLLDVFIDLNASPAVNGRFGRMKTPFTYEFLVDPIQGLLMPERSIFFNNFGQNRDTGFMAFGRLFDQRLDYAVGVYNGARNGTLSFQDSKFGSGLVNMRPFLKSEGSPLQYFNFGGSFFAGSTYNAPTVPQVLRTVVPTGGNAILGIPFLTFNNNIRETGYQAFWDLYFAWYYKQLAVIGEWASGFQDYAAVTTPNIRTPLSVDSFYVQAGYLLTGETRNGLGIVKPKQPFSLRTGHRGPGAWELVGRYQHLDLSQNVFTDGLADPNNWANRVEAVDLGFNWHMTQYLKLYFLWEHCMFNDPVLYAPGKRQLTADEFIVRLQLYF